MKKLAFSIQLTVCLTPTVGKKKNEGQREILFLRGGRREKGMNLLCARLHVRHFVQVSHFILTILSSWCCYAHFTDEEKKA